MKAGKRCLALLLTAVLVTVLAGCAGSLKIEGDPWTMDIIQDNQSGEMLYRRERSAVFPAELLKLTLTAEDGRLHIEDDTGENTREGSYKKVQSYDGSVIYEVTMEKQTGKAVVSTTEEGGKATQTLILSFEGFALRFTR